MDILEGAAAFAVVMIVMSTIVTGIAEAFVRLLAVRQAVLVEAIERLVVDRIAPAIAAQIGKELKKADDSGLTAEALARVKNALTLSPLADHARIGGPLSKMRFGHERITTYSFLQRLAKSQLGDALAQYGRAELRERLTDIARTYERYAAAAAERFRYKAHRYTAVIAVLFAFGANIDAGRVFVHLMENPEIRAKLIEQADPAFRANQDAQARLQRVLDGDTGEGTLEEARKAADEARRALDRVTAEAALPIGPSYYPFCGDTFIGRLFDKPACAGVTDRTWFGWIAYTALAGVLIGLGGPFWYRVYASLSKLLSVARDFTGGGGETITKESDGQPASKKALTEEDIVTTFMTARANEPKPAP